MMGQVRSLCELASLVDSEEELYIRWSERPCADFNGRSRGDLTGVELPGMPLPLRLNRGGAPCLGVAPAVRLPPSRAPAPDH